ncbi:ATPase/histidine kinase/DNA gyrase B/HSP90 domain protein [Desulfamplus magnetovallimortis]|uniref:histidine kinase n=1 Tax=Desulfamplus magnetovallimortis TaxID=1246637 RepID=A0A1W1H6G3_9BACT|nr:PAS domain-containing sensor histidine kinase [Desulfamplus magnetovallimortis]SLM28024.1 ATPase/histidine kinase/DNA gyrase B/HSP90 domain protein [Desulfamplus magnetovallimortis]
MQNKKQIEKRRLEQVKRAILTNMIIVPFIPFVMAIGVSFYYFTTSLESKSISSLKRIVGDHGDMIDSFLMERKADLELISNIYTFEDINENGSIQTIFENLRERSGAFIDLGLFDSHGLHVRYAGNYELKGKKYQDELWFREVMQNGYYVSDIFLGYRNVPHFVIAVRKGEGADSWILRATIDTLFFDNLVFKAGIGRSGESFILNREGVAQTGRRSGEVEIMQKDEEFARFPPPLKGSLLTAEEKSLVKAGDTIQTFIQSGNSGNQYLYAITWINGRDWLLVVRQEKKDAYSAFYSALYISLFIMVAGGAVIIVMAFYITERTVKRIEKLGQEKESLGHQLIRATQLAEIGEMAAGFAHEINNPLQIIKSEHALIETLIDEIREQRLSKHSVVAREEKTPLVSDIEESASSLSVIEESASLQSDIEKRALLSADRDASDALMAEIEESLDQIKLQVNRCSEITHAILKFGRKNDTKKQSLFPSLIIPEIIHMIEKKAAVNGIQIVREIAADTPAFVGDASQFQQVMLNLFNNAMDAIADRHGVSGGRLTIESFKNIEDMLEITITDNGAGIRPENIEKIFSPFFTTKPVGKGTGLGLSVCYGIIEGFGGSMKVRSELDIGTTFIITLPIKDV